MFEIEGEIAIDRRTDLMWQLEGIHLGRKVTWAQAESDIQKLNIESAAGHNNWRLPELKELQGLLCCINKNDWEDRGKPYVSKWFQNEGISILNQIGIGHQQKMKQIMSVFTGVSIVGGDFSTSRMSFSKCYFWPVRLNIDLN